MEHLHLGKLFCRALLEAVIMPARQRVSGDLTEVQSAALCFIQSHPGTSLQELAKGLQISSPAATKLVDRLAERGWVTREADSKDRRKWILKLTSPGKNLWTQVMDGEEDLFAQIMAELPVEQREQFLVGIGQFVQIVSRRVGKEDLCLRCGNREQEDCILRL